MTAGVSSHWRRLGSMLRDAVDATVPDGPVAVLPFQQTGNCGDHAIWVCTLHLLRSLGRAVRLAESGATFDPVRYRRATDGGSLVFAGGGNFGDRYPGHDGLRRWALHQLKDRRIVNLPQTLEYRSAEHLDRMRRAVASHPDVVLTWRDARSYELAVANFDCEHLLLPDVVFALEHVPVHRGDGPAMALARSDEEAGHDLSATAARRGLVVRDWPTARDLRQPQHALAAYSTKLTFARDRRRRPRHPLGRLRSRLFEADATGRVQRALDLLAGPSAIVTDRLHGHLLCERLGVPHAVVDTAAGKISAVHDTWLAPWSATAVHSSAEDACDEALALAAAGKS